MKTGYENMDSFIYHQVRLGVCCKFSEIVALVKKTFPGTGAGTVQRRLQALKAAKKIERRRKSGAKRAGWYPFTVPYEIGSWGDCRGNGP